MSLGAALAETRDRVTSSGSPDARSAGPTDGAEALHLDEVYHLLANERRRRVIEYLRTESASTTLSDLAEHVASLETGKPVRALSSQERKGVYVCLYQSHLPKLDEADVVDFDEHRKSVDIGDAADEVTRFLPDWSSGGSVGLATAMAGLLGSTA